MSSYKGGGPHDVEYSKPSFAENKFKNKMQKTSATALTIGPGGASAIQLSTVRYAYGKDRDEAIGKFTPPSSLPVVQAYRQALAYPYEWESPDDPAASAYAIEHLLEDGGSYGLITRLRLAWDLTSGPRDASPLRRAYGFEARVIRPVNGYSYSFVWRPVAGDPKFYRCKISNYATFAAIWKTDLAIEDVPQEIFDAMEENTDYEIRPGSRLHLVEPAGGGEPQVYLCVPSAAGSSSPGTYHRITSPEVFDFCGFTLNNFVYADKPAGYAAGRDITYDENEIRGL